MSLYIFHGLIYHQRTSRDLENHPCNFSIINVILLIVNLIHFMHNPLLAEHPNQRAIVEKILYISIDYKYMLFWRQKSRDSLRACNFRFAFLHIVLRCSIKSSLLSIMTPKSFFGGTVLDCDIFKVA